MVSLRCARSCVSRCNENSRPYYLFICVYIVSIEQIQMMGRVFRRIFFNVVSTQKQQQSNNRIQSSNEMI